MALQEAHIHPQAIVESTAIGAGSRVGAFSHIWPNIRLGRHVVVADHVVIAGDVTVGDDSAVGHGARLCGNLRIADGVRIGPNTVFVGDGMDGADTTERPSATNICSHVTIGANATIGQAVTVGEAAVIEAGSVVNRDVPRNAIVSGNPARITGYVHTHQQPAFKGAANSLGGDKSALRVKGAKLIEFPCVVDLRGALTFGQIDQHLPFEPKRFFLVHQVPSEELRGEHAHKQLHELLICLTGSCSVMIDDGVQRDEVRLDSPQLGLHVPPELWRVHYKYTPDAILLSLCSDVYDAGDYIRDYDDFLSHVGVR